MITWTSKGGAALCGLLLLGACEDGDAFLAGLTPAPQAPTRQATMARGTVSVVPPQGYCIDNRALGQRFALMARCDVISGEGLAAAPLSVITVSLSPAPEGAALPTPATTAAALGLSDVQNTSQRRTSVIFRANGPAPSQALDGRHWRGTALVGGQIMGVALYGPAGRPPIGREGRAILSDLIAGTKAVQ